MVPIVSLPVMRILTALVLLVLPHVIAKADIRLPNLFSDHMVLQQKSVNAIWGFADPEEKISVTSTWGSEVTTAANEEGRWQIFLETPAHSTGHSLHIRGKNSVSLMDVAIGEVWLCAGQSNMGWALGNCFDSDAEAKHANIPNFRIFKS